VGKDFEMELSPSGIERLTFLGKEVPVYKGRFHRINFYDPSSVRIIPAVDVIKGRYKGEFFKDKAVFVGATEIGIYDVRPTPVDPVTPGVFLHLFTFSNFMEEHFIFQSLYLDSLLILILSTAPFLIAFRKNFYERALSYFALFVGFPLTSYLAFAFLSVETNLFYPFLGFFLSLISQEGIRIFTAERSVRELRRAFSSYVSPQLLEIITRDPHRLSLGGEKREITVLFSDIRGFTTISERLNPEDLVNLLNQFLDPMTEIILSKGGMLDKYIGDAIMAVYNAPVDIQDHADRACESALEMVKKTRMLNERFTRDFKVDIRIGVGINTGEAVVGNMGSSLRFDYTAIGDTVNLASRLEGLNKVYKTDIIISQFTKEKLKGGFLTRKLDVVVVKGKREPVPIYELLEDSDKNRSLAKDFEAALEEYFAGNFENAMLMFEEVGIRYGDETSSVFVKRCREMIEEPPEKWTGIYIAKEK
jgi:adenylate cyclase